MTTKRRTHTVTSPASTHCSELEYLIQLQTDELFSSQLRRSQRLRQRQQTLTDVSQEVINISSCTGVAAAEVGSPQLFLETDEECSQLAQVPPIQQSAKAKRSIAPVSSSAVKRPRRDHSEFSVSSQCDKAASKATPPIELSSEPQLATIDSQLHRCELNNLQPIVLSSEPSQTLLEATVAPIEHQPSPKKKRGRPKLNQPKHRNGRGRRKQQPTILSSEPQPEPKPSELQPETRPSELQAKTKPSELQGALASHDCAFLPAYACDHSFQQQQPTVIPSEANPSIFNSNAQSQPQSKRRSRKRPSLSSTLVKQECPEKRTKVMQQPTTMMMPQLKTKFYQNCDSQPAKQQSAVIPAETNPTSVVTAQSHSYQRMNLTQTVLPARYPAHFIHQLPPDHKYMRGIMLPGGSQADIKEPINSLLTPDSSTTEVHDTCSASPQIGESSASTTPSLSESLSEVFGTTKIRDILNIKPPRKYLLLEVHLPAIAFMLNVELARLRFVLGLTQRLTVEQLQQMSQESVEELISVHSSSDENAD